jgi:hypothetical protein
MVTRGKKVNQSCGPHTSANVAKTNEAQPAGIAPVKMSKVQKAESEKVLAKRGAYIRY